MVIVGTANGRELVVFLSSARLSLLQGPGNSESGPGGGWGRRDKSESVGGNRTSHEAIVRNTLEIDLVKLEMAKSILRRRFDPISRSEQEFLRVVSVE